MRLQLKNERENYFSYQDLNHGPFERKASVLPMSYADLYLTLYRFRVGKSC